MQHNRPARNKKDEQADLKEIGIHDGMLRSRFEEVHGPNGLFNALVGWGEGLLIVAHSTKQLDKMISIKSLKVSS